MLLTILMDDTRDGPTSATYDPAYVLVFSWPFAYFGTIVASFFKDPGRVSRYLTGLSTI